MQTRRRRRSPDPDTTLPARDLPHFKLAVVCLFLAVLVIPAEIAFGGIHAPTLSGKLLALGTLVLFVVLAGLGVRSAALETARSVRLRAGRSAGTTVGVVVAVLGSLLILATTLSLLGITTKNVLLGGALLAVLLAAALQQTLGNVFAGVVLLWVRPFSVGDHIRIRGSFGPELRGTVDSISLLHVVLQTDEGQLHVPNSGVLSAAVGPCPMTPDPALRTEGGPGLDHRPEPREGSL